MASNFHNLQNIPPDLLVIQLPYDVYEGISNRIDGSASTLQNPYMSLGHHLGYTVQECITIERRCANGRSPTEAMLLDFATVRCGTVYHLQYALMCIGNHPAARVIPEFMMCLPRRCPRQSANQNSEPSTCGCPTCFYQAQVNSVGRIVRNTPSSPVQGQPVISVPSVSKQNNRREQTPTVPTSPSSQSNSHLQNGNNVSYIGRDHENNLDHQQENTQSQDQRGGVPPNGGRDQDMRREPAIGSSTPSLRDAEQVPPPGPFRPMSHSPVDNSLNSRFRFPRSCDCDKCRLASDPDQTGVLTTINSPPRSACQILNYFGELRLSNLNTDSSSTEINNRLSNSDNIGAGIGELRRSVDSDQTQTKQSYESENTRAEHKPLCIKSTRSNTHALGERSDKCSACRQHREEEGKKRKTWPDDKREESFQLNKRTSSSESDCSVSGNRRIAANGSIELQQIYEKVSFSNPAVSTTGSDRRDQNATLDANEISERLQSLNDRNNIDWNSGRVNEPQRQNSGQDGPESGGSSVAQADAGMNREFVFVTYSYNVHTDSKQHLHEIIELCRKLRAAGIRVKIDMDPETFEALRLNRHDWLDRMTREARYVVVCISPTYYMDTQEPSDSAGLQPQPAVTQLNARYIFNNLRAEFHGNGARNRRFLPVLFPTSGATAEHIPLCMRSTLVYNYHRDVQHIIQIIRGENDDANFRLPYGR